MFLGIARYAVKGPIHAATVVGILAILSLIPFVPILTGGIVSLIVLTQGITSSAGVILIPIAVVFFGLSVIWGDPWIWIGAGLFSYCIVAMVFAELLRRSRSLPFSMVVGAVLCILLIVAQFGFWPDAEMDFAPYVRLMYAIMGLASLPEIEESIMAEAISMEIALMSGFYLSWVVTLLLGRWYQAKLSGSNGFREEFHALCLGKKTALASLGLLVSGVSLQNDLLLAISTLMMTAFFFQGLAVSHSWSRHFKRPGTLKVMYVFLVLVPLVRGLATVLGLVDNWMDFRAKFKSVPMNTDD